MCTYIMHNFSLKIGWSTVLYKLTYVYGLIEWALHVYVCQFLILIQNHLTGEVYEEAVGIIDL